MCKVLMSKCETFTKAINLITMFLLDLYLYMMLAVIQ